MEQVDPEPPVSGHELSPETAPGRDALRRRRVVDYALQRRFALAGIQKGTHSLAEVCDADVYLLRAAAFHGDVTDTLCPVCRKENLTHVSWVFGEDLASASGTARQPREVQTLALRHDAFTVHVVEVCRSCAWNHLVLSYEVGLPEGTGRTIRRAATHRRKRPEQ